MEELLTNVALLASPGEFYGPGGAGYVRIAAVQTDDRIQLLELRLEIR